MELVKEINGKTFEDFAIAFMKKYRIYTQDERLDALMDYIPYVIENFEDCSSEEEFRMKAKKQDQTLATIQIPHKESGWLLYKPIPITNAKDYKHFYYQTLVFSLVQYILFFQGAEFDILENGKSVGKFSIEEEQLPHLLGLENKYVSKNDCALLEKIIPGYNQLSILDKILALVENQDKIIKWEDDSQIDIFNYYKNMQKNKEFLLMGRFFSDEEDLSQEYNRIFILQSKDNQLSLYKKSNMNKTMQRKISKIILQKGLDSVYFPKSLQAISEQILHTSEALNLFQYGKGDIKVDGIEALIESDGLKLEVKVPSLNQMLAKKYRLKILTFPPSTEEYETKKEQSIESTDPLQYSLMQHLLEVAGIEQSIVEPYKKDNNSPIKEDHSILIQDTYDEYLEYHYLFNGRNEGPPPKFEISDEQKEIDVIEELKAELKKQQLLAANTEALDEHLTMEEQDEESLTAQSKKKK